ncbi:uncharacterized protein LOC111089391 [Limulus polyphemus]|uniref:Uncharacterized protein LOC111089391 n=1 Tax=Limulus polyphemus TaxID=6850 RepID=A0ABM1TNQ8_LIMPO|nr:uncharacterized protein LOC111089391 [Limulus polyphemus]
MKNNIAQLIIGLICLPVLVHILVRKFQVVCQDKIIATECTKTVQVFIEKEEKQEIRNLLKLSNDLDVTTGLPEVTEETLDSTVNNDCSEESGFPINHSSSSDDIYQEAQTIQSDEQVCTPHQIQTIQSDEQVCTPHQIQTTQSDEQVCTPHQIQTIQSDEQVCTPHQIQTIQSDEQVCTPHQIQTIQSDEQVCTPDQIRDV